MRLLSISDAVHRIWLKRRSREFPVEDLSQFVNGHLPAWTFPKALSVPIAMRKIPVASSRLGVFIFINCSAIHRGFETHTSFVRSCTLDLRKDEEASIMERLGNAKANTYWEARLSSDSIVQMTNFIEKKYEFAKWADRHSPLPIFQPNLVAVAIERNSH